jgi:8-oxo-dGTP diphosphatase
MSRDINVRVYGILVWNDQVLVSDEQRYGRQFTKFPGGGLKFGEGIKDCLIREFMEELGIEIEVGTLVYLNDFLQKSAFDENSQVISIYYWVSTSLPETIVVQEQKFAFTGEEQELHRWVALQELHASHFHFPIDQKVVEHIAYTSR